MSVLATRQIGSTGLRVTELGFGSAALGNRYRILTEGACARLVDDAWERGVRFFDTAPMYGHGLAENRLGTALRMRPRDDYVLASKVGRLLRPSAAAAHDDMWRSVPPMAIRYDYSYDGTLRSIEDSLQRLLVDRIDIAFIHDCDRYGHGDQQPTVFDDAMRGAARALFELRDQGVIGAVGVGVNEADVCLAAAHRGGFDCFLLAGRYTLLEQDSLDDLMPLCTEQGISLILGGVFNSGILASGVRAGAHHNYGPPDPAVQDRVRHIETACSRHEVPLTAVALQFCLAHPAVASVLVGASTVEQHAANVAAAAVSIPTDLWQELRGGELIRRDAPVPSDP